jgi:hypothetical protein
MKVVVDATSVSHPPSGTDEKNDKESYEHERGEGRNRATTKRHRNSFAKNKSGIFSFIDQRMK